MQTAERLPKSTNGRDQQTTLRLAWLSLLIFLTVFLALAGTTVNTLWNWYLSADDPRTAALILRSQPDGLAFRPADRSVYQGVIDGQILVEGDTLRALPTAGYGQVATLKMFDESQIDLWAGSELTMAALRTSRWHSARQQVALIQSSGYARYDLRDGQPFRRVEFAVTVDDAVVALTPGGSYSIALHEPQRLVQRADGRVVHTVDVAVRSGSALVTDADGRQVLLTAGQRLELDAASRALEPQAASWELIRDGDFSRFTEPEYNNTTAVDDPALVRSTTWQVSGTPSLPIEQRGFFRLAPICPPPDVESRCRNDEVGSAAWFFRSGGQTNGFVTSVSQMLGADGSGVDVSEYRSLRFSLWVRVLFQSLPAAGDRGTECPVMVRIVGRQTSPSDPDEERVICFYTLADGQDLTARADAVSYIELQPAEWLFFAVDLRDAAWMPDFRFLRSVEIYANGHDYDSRVTEVSLVGVQ